MNYDEEDRLGAAEDLAPISQGGSGQLVRITTPFAAVYDPATGGMTAGDPTYEYGAGVVEAYAAHLVDGSRIQVGDKKLILSALRFNADETLMTPETALTRPTSSAVLRFSGAVDWSVIKVEAIEPAGLPIIFTLQLREG